jgi:uncharacterized membrane protein
MSQPRVTDAGIERVVSVLLRTGVLIAASVVFAGGIYYLTRHGGEPANYRHFTGQPSIDRIVTEIVEGALALRARSVIQLGILLLIATPIARVAVSLVAFVLERDRTYVAITALVLAVLLISLITGAVGG